MLSKVISGAVIGLEATPIEVEVDIAARGFPAFGIVGLPDKAIEEAKERVRAALRNSQAELPSRRITVNLSPADLPKQGPAYDFPISLGILFAAKHLPKADMTDTLVLGELSLDGSLKHTPGVLPLVLMAKEHNFKKVFLPAVNAREASVVEGIEIYPVKELTEVVHHFQELKEISPFRSVDDDLLGEEVLYELDFKDIIGQERAKLALTIAAAGGHNVAMSGPAGSGKTLLARTLPTILPSLSTTEALEVTKIASITGMIPQGHSLIRHRPFRSPHHTVSRVGLIGGGSNPIPGEISLAHRGVLFLDEFPEFPRHVLEALRQPLEDGVVSISRARMSVTFPANFMLVTAQNPCPCGNYGELKKECKCSQHQILRYKKRVSGPMLDRIDLHVDVPTVDVDKLTLSSKGLPTEKSMQDSATVRKIVQSARERQLARFKGTKMICNAEMGVKALKKYCKLNDECAEVMRQATKTHNLSARSYHKIVKIARTMADIEGVESLTPKHLSNALQFRARE